MYINVYYILIAIIVYSCTVAKADDHVYTPHVSVAKAIPPEFYQYIEDIGKRKASPRGLGVTNPYLSDITVKALNGKNKTYSNTISMLTVDERKEAIRNNDELMQNSGAKYSTTRVLGDSALRYVNKGITVTISPSLLEKYPDNIGP